MRPRSTHNPTANTQTLHANTLHRLNDTVPRKRISLSMKLNTKPTSTALFQYFLRMPDQLVSTAHFRSEAMRKIKATRDEETRKIKKGDEDEKAE